MVDDVIELKQVYQGGIPFDQIQTQILEEIDFQPFLQAGLINTLETTLETIAKNPNLDLSKMSPPFGIWNDILLSLQISKDQEFPPNAYKNLPFLPITSYKATLVRHDRRTGVNNHPDINQAGIQAIIETSDGKYLLGGIRGGAEHVGFEMPGGGSIIYPRQEMLHSDPLVNGIYTEMLHEFGIETSSILEAKLCGIYSSEQYSNVSFATIIKVDLTSEELVEMHNNAMDVYEAAKARFSEEDPENSRYNELRARKAIEEAGLLNIDAWEHQRGKLLFVEATKKAILHRFEQNETEVSGIARGVYACVLQALYGHELSADKLNPTKL